MAAFLTDEQIAAMTVEERLDRIERTLPPVEIPNPLSEWHFKLIAERLAHSEANTRKSRPWREVMNEIQARTKS